MKLTLPQQDIYYEQLLYPQSPIYNIGAKIEIKGNIAFEVLNDAYKKLINQHDAYRSYVVHENKVVAIKTNEYFNGELEYLDCTLKSDAEAYANSFMQEKMTTAFSLKKDTQLHYFVLIKVSEASYYLFSIYHHIITDGWGTSLMFQRLVKNYNELFESKDVSTYPFTYTDFVLDDTQYAASESYEKDKIYWAERFKQLPVELLSPKKNNKITPKSDRKTLTIKRETYDLLTQLGKQNGGSTFHVILATLFLYFGRKHQNDEFAIGLPVLNRGKSIFKKTVGLFMGVLPLKIAVNLEGNFGELIKTIRSQLRLDYRHQRFPLGKIIKELKLYTEKKRLFNITLSYEKQNYADHFLNTNTKVIPLSHQAERVALALYIREFDNTEDVLLDFDYNLNYFDEKEIKNVVAHIDNLINELIKTPVKSLHSYTYLTEKETEIVLKEFNSTHYKYPSNQTVVDQVIAQVRLHPNKIAIEDGIKQYTYAQLDELSTKVASYILESSDSVTMSIAVLMNRSVDLIVTLIGVIKAGKTFIPLDPSFPKARLSYILAHSETSKIIGNEKLKNAIEHTGEYISIETILTTKNIEKQDPINKSKSENTAYIIYTSGSTGNPKGVAIAHHSLLNFLISMKQSPKIEENDRFFSVTTQSFDISILEFFAPLLCGSTVFIAKEHVLQEPSKTIEAIKKNNTTIIQATPSFYQLLFNAGWKGNKKLKILCGGDLLSASLAEKLLENCGEVWNMYGPTETTIWSSCKKIQESTDASCIGKPIHNTKMYVLDEKLQLLPVGSAGNIYISGDGVAQGYYKNNELTNERFITSPYEIAGKMYNTGDVGNWNEKGEIEFLGRNDHQVKIRGYRIELGDIEAKLEAINTIKQAVVVAKKNKNQEVFLLAYITKETEEFSVSTTFSTLSIVLPNYMIPNMIIEVAEFPLTPNKKVDRKQLTERELSNQSNDKIKQKPSSILEKHLAKIFKEVLELKNTIGIDENFFELGGHSLNAVKVVNAIEQELSHKIYLETIFNNPTIQKLANFLTNAKTDAIRQIASAPELPFYPIIFSQYVIWLASLQSEKSIAYNMFAAYEI
ncbi:amino acid adenylation domain-containing protein, partial [Flavobacteriaceae bacterium]|nr:amino acid adenylation domain-containing protein [Flavobacteriaceae bacterium]